MKLYVGTRKILLPGRTFCLLTLSLLLFLTLSAQETNSRASGRVYSEDNEKIDATITLIHEPTQNTYAAVTRTDGFFSFFNLRPGGPYTALITSVGYDTLRTTNLYVHLTDGNFLLDNRQIAEFTLRKKVTSLEEVKVISRNNFGGKTGIETVITDATLKAMPTISRSFQDFVRLVPQAKVNGDGVMSLAGQNNRFNAFYIDGANNTDIKGVSVNGMNGGQTGSSPVSIEAIEEINVLQAPYNTQYGNFTGGSINAITRSGSNENKSAVWYYFRNEDLAGRSPQPLEKTGSPGEFHRPKLTNFFNQTFGAWNSGALVRNKLFYFVLFERQNDDRPQPFNILDYRGSTNEQQLLALTEFINSTYHYDPGSFSETKDQLIATRVNVKLDWNPTMTDKFMLSYRLNDAWRMTPPRPSSAIAISFHNNGIIIPSTTHSASFEWKHFLKSNINNRLLATFTSQEDQRKWIGQPFPAVTIFDGNGTLNFGSENATGINDFKGLDFGLFNVFTYSRNKHVYSVGTDINYTTIDVSAVPAYFGAYQFKSVTDFMNTAPATRLQRFFYYAEHNGAKFHTLKTSFFVNDEFRAQANLKFNFGLRLDLNSIPTKPAEDQFFNDSALTIISKYYDLEQARSGSTMNAHWSLSPRVGIEYKLPKRGITLRAGGGIFQGHIVNAWLFDIFNSNTGNIDIVTQQFIPDPYNQPTPQTLNKDPEDYKGFLCLMAKHFKYPSVFRTSFSAEKRTSNNWVFSMEGIFTKNIYEAVFRNVNIMPPIGQSPEPDARNVYSTGLTTTEIELKPNGTIKNPYAGIYLLTNNHDAKQFSYSLSFVIQKQIKRFSFNGSYTYGRSNVLFEITGPQTPIPSQWRNMETINGRNFTSGSVSDNDLGHRVTAWISKEFNYAKGRTSTTLSLFYNGQSGSPYSYVYQNSMINDNNKRGENFDLIYIPTEEDLGEMIFVPITTPVAYSPQEQKDALNAFIESDRYLSRHRGEFSKRNAARLPFTNIIDLRIQQDLLIRINKKPARISIIYDVFNFTNMLNKNWGQINFLSNDSYPLIRFESFVNSTMIPQYQFTPLSGKPYSLQTSTIPGSSARWISQLGIKINLN